MERITAGASFIGEHTSLHVSVIACVLRDRRF
jgi:hypothetical protein